MGMLRDVVRQHKNINWLAGWGLAIGLLIGLVLGPARSAPDPNSLKVQGADTIGNYVQVWSVQPGAAGTTITNVGASSANAAAANNNALPASAGVTTYCTGFEVTGAGATAASVITITLTNTLAGTLNYQLAIPAGATAGVTPLIVEFNPPLQATGTGIAPTINVPSFGVGNTNAAVSIHGFRQ